MGASNLPNKDEIEIQMWERIAELEKANQDFTCRKYGTKPGYHQM